MPVSSDSDDLLEPLQNIEEEDDQKQGSVDGDRLRREREAWRDVFGDDSGLDLVQIGNGNENASENESQSQSQSENESESQ
jgi:hypothetical protein